jgi:uncharacterized protein YlxW (UPF0749 family)
VSADHKTSQPPSAWRTLARAFAPRATHSQVITGLLCALLGFALVVQVRANRDDGLASLRQDELVRILDDVTRRGDELEEQIAALRAQRTELVTGSDTERAAREAAAQRSQVEGILAGRLPAEGPGVELVVRGPGEPLPAPVLYNVLEELRNAGAEAIQVGDQRITASSYFVDTTDGVEVDGVVLKEPYRWLAIGDPDTIVTALSIPGGALAAVRNAGGTAEIEARDVVEVTAIREVTEPQYATPAPAAEESDDE